MNSINLLRLNDIDDLWTITFTDLLTLLIGFFVLRYTLFTNLEAAKSPSEASTSAPIEIESITFEKFKDFLRKTSSYREVRQFDEAERLQTALVFNDVVKLTSTSTGVRIELDTTTLGLSSDENSLSLNATLSAIAKMIRESGELIHIRYVAPEVTSNYSLLDSGWNNSVAIASSLYRQLIDNGVERKKITLETLTDKNPGNKGILTIEVIESAMTASNKSTLGAVLLNLNRSQGASETQMIFLDL